MKWIVAVSALVPSLAAAQAPGSSLELGRTARIQSQALGEERIIDVALPRGYDASTDRYPVIVVLDGESVFEVATGIARFYGSTGMMPRAIVVGVRNTRRTRDMTPAAITGFTVPREANGAGGADRLVAFLADELLPYLDRTYRTVPMRVLVGHSLGGLFAMYMTTTRPEVFIGLVAMEPSIWWNNESEWKGLSRALARPANRRTRLVLVNTPQLGADTTRWGGDAPMVRQIDVSGETHETMPAAGMLGAFRAIFADFRPLQWRPGTRPVAMLERYDSLAARVGYDVPISENAYQQAIRMSIHARHWDDAERMLGRMESRFGVSRGTELRELLAEERAMPIPAGYVELEIPVRRPRAADARAFMGTWDIVGSERGHEITIRPSGDTLIVHSRIQHPDGSWDAGERHVIQLTADGTLEWGLPWFRGLAALLVQNARLQPDGTLRITREPRGWVPRDPNARESMYRSEVFKRRT
jgi:predicted alpha/beta superfamily hydrolase